MISISSAARNNRSCSSCSCSRCCCSILRSRRRRLSASRSSTRMHRPSHGPDEDADVVGLLLREDRSRRSRSRSRRNCARAWAWAWACVCKSPWLCAYWTISCSRRVSSRFFVSASTIWRSFATSAAHSSCLLICSACLLLITSCVFWMAR